MKLTGLAFSGGGIRSATFNLGVLQDLAERDLLPHFDYLSTVSGGGYIGSWFATWIKRAGSVSKVTQRLDPKRSADPMADEVQPIRWLRMYSNYLAPDASIMSADAWTVGVTWLRNTVINQVILLLLLCTGLSLINVLFRAWRYWTQRLDTITPLYIAIWAIIILLPGTVFAALGMRSYDRTQPPQAFFNLGTHKFLAVFMVGWAVVASYLISSWLFYMPYEVNTVAAVAKVLWPAALVGSVFVIAVAIVGNYHRYAQSVMQKRMIYPTIVISSIIAAIAGIYMLGGVWAIFHHLEIKICDSIVLQDLFEGSIGWLHYKVLFIIGVPLILEVMSLCVVIRMALMGNLFPDEKREWWGRMGAITHRFMLTWIIATTSALILYQLLAGLYTNPKAFTTIVGGWGAVIATAVKMAYDTTSSGENKEKTGWTVKEIFIRVAPYIFMVGFLFIGAALLQFFNRTVDNLVYAQVGINKTSVHQVIIHNPIKHTAIVHQTVITKIHYSFFSKIVGSIAVTLIIGGLTLLLSWRIGVNEFSLHHFYRNRLVRAYLGATRRRVDRNKTANSFTGFDKADDIKLSEFLVEKEYYGPYPILNTALNATSVTELDRQDRKAEAFIFSPLFCGFDFSPTRSTANNKNHVYEYGYRPTLNFAYDRGPNIGTAMAISGAAVNPNMGYHSSSATAFLLTIFNVRLGWWMGNPRLNRWKRSDPETGIAYIVKDLIGKTDIDSDYVCLSDGGHFDNMGLYELIRRRCTYIILGDGEEDPKAVCEGLANAIRRCRIDFGAEIVIDTAAITEKDKDTGFSKQRVIVNGTIAYPGDSQPSGTLIYIKTTLTAPLPTDVREYQMQNIEFPQQSTGDQFFDESQFESYRKLGYHALDGVDLNMPFKKSIATDKSKKP
ncbi:hypothetical protein GSY63_19300 [Mucilaginibacter sp. R11]|uniref:PNPLA domain-containing protein n=2 Tax=Mucilaginibacter agri TaxID=2695265 RepID=A0A965ZKW3_9SPHI|nr:hypothetical protein [Mucilaginibacter agri]